MSEELRLLKLVSSEAEADSSFIAFLMKKYQEMENISKEEIISRLHCSEEDYVMLNLCKIPDINASDYTSRLEEIANYTNSSLTELNKIIKRASVVRNMSESEVELQQFLMAARDKDNKDKS
jgi:hypothetical protein